MAKKKAAPAAKKNAAKKTVAKKVPKTLHALSKAKRRAVVKDLHAVLKKHDLTARIESVTFAGNSQCFCSDGRPGVLRVIGGQLVCCDSQLRPC